MISQLERRVRNLQKELAEVQKEQAVLRLQPCRGDSEIWEKDRKREELDGRAKTISETIRGLERKRQKLMAESNIKDGSCS